MYSVHVPPASVNLFNALIPSADVITLDNIVSPSCCWHALSSKEIDNHRFTLLFDHSFLPDRARLLSVSSPNSAAWLSILPSPGLNLHLDPQEFQIALKWWLGTDLAQGLNCTSCPSLALILWATMLLLASMQAILFPATINSVMFLWSVVGKLMYLPKSRLEVALGMTNATPDQQMLLSPTGLLGSLLHLILPLSHR